ncbi:hypothetical protein K523DRAFT_357500 [Schizophyllum commune Tattone D]|nr:hypothetical protein K523DRAFT_357500 [Schizophyllum commune Tattone D]
MNSRRTRPRCHPYIKRITAPRRLPTPLATSARHFPAPLPSATLNTYTLNIAPSFITDVTDAIVLFSAFLLTEASLDCFVPFTLFSGVVAVYAWSSLPDGAIGSVPLAAAVAPSSTAGRAARCRRPRAIYVLYLVLSLSSFMGALS